MTGTACEFSEYSNDSLTNKNLDLFSAWLFGKINANCTLADLSRDGCSILIPREQAIPGKSFRLLLMTPHNSDQLHSVLNAEQCWIKEDYSATHKKIGVAFLEVDPDQSIEIDALSENFELIDAPDIMCCLLKNTSYLI